MRQCVKNGMITVVFLIGSAVVAVAGTWTCPDTDGSRHREAMATSAPEIKVKTATQSNGSRWAEIIKPLTQKAVKAAKARRSAQIEDGVERACTPPEQFMGQILPVGNRASGCEHHVVTRPADDQNIWVEVVAVCSYDWACCSPDARSTRASDGYSLEGPLNSTVAGSTPTKRSSK